MQTLRIVKRGLADAFEHLLAFSLWSLTWWVGMAPAAVVGLSQSWLALLVMIPTSGMTVALFAMTDPRRAIDRPSYGEGFRVAVRSFKRGALLALVTLPIVAVLLRNITFYSENPGRFGVLVPLWAALLITGLAITLTSFAVLALLETSVPTALKAGLVIVFSRPGRAIVIFTMLLVIVALSAVLVIPAVVIAPAIIAAIVNRWVLAGMEVSVPDPSAPTEERLQEQRDRGAGRRGRRG